MKERKKLGARVLAALLLVAASLFGVALPAHAGTSDCPTGTMCTWNAAGYSGVPTYIITGPTSSGTWVNVADNVTSSGYNRYNGCCRWNGMNQLTVFNYETVARWNYGVALNLAGSAADNKIDDMQYGWL